MSFNLSAFGPGVAFFLEWFELLTAFLFFTFLSVRLLLRHSVCVPQTSSLGPLDRGNSAFAIIHLPIVPEEIELPQITVQVFAADVVIDADESTSNESVTAFLSGSGEGCGVSQSQKRIGDAF